MTQITLTAERHHVTVVDRDLIVLDVLCLIGLFVSLGLMLLLPGDEAASLLALTM